MRLSLHDKSGLDENINEPELWISTENLVMRAMKIEFDKG